VGLQPHLAQLESGVGGGWGCTPVVHRLISAPQVKLATSTHTLRERYHASKCIMFSVHVIPCLHSWHVFTFCNKPNVTTPQPACVLGGAPNKANCGNEPCYREVGGGTNSLASHMRQSCTVCSSCNYWGGETVVLSFVPMIKRPCRRCRCDLRR